MMNLCDKNCEHPLMDFAIGEPHGLLIQSVRVNDQRQPGAIQGRSDFILFANRKKKRVIY